MQDIAKAYIKGRELFGRFSQSRGRLQTAPRLVDEVFSRPVISISKMSRERGVSFSAVQMGMDRSVQIGILRQVTDRKRNRLFVASKLLDVLSRPTSCN